MGRTNKKELNKTETEAQKETNNVKNKENTMDTTTETNNEETTSAQETVTVAQREGTLKYLEISEIAVPQNSVRMDIYLNKDDGDNKFKALVRSIEKNNILTPVLARENEDGTYLLIDGLRRIKAAEAIGLEKVPAVIYDDEAEKSQVLNIISNVTRKKLSPLELGMAYSRLVVSGVYESNKELSENIGVSESSVGDSINNLKLDKRIIEDLLENNSISDQKILKSIRTIEKADENGTSDKQWSVYTHIRDNKFNRKETIKYIREQKGSTVETVRYVKLASSNKLKVEIDTSKLEQEKVDEINELLEQIKKISEEFTQELAA